MLNTFTNFTGKEKCVDYKRGKDYSNLDTAVWDYQVSCFKIQRLSDGCFMFLKLLKCIVIFKCLPPRFHLGNFDK